MKTQIFVGFLLGLMFTWPAFSNEKQRIFFNFSEMNITSHGVYMPEASGKHAMNPMKAEIVARTNGIDSIRNYLSSSCQDMNPSLRSFDKQLDKKFRSQGTEIYADGALKVNLVASYFSVFKTNEKDIIKTNQGETLVFVFPQKIDVNALKCGAPMLELMDTNNQRVEVRLMPAVVKKSLDGHEKLIKLKLNANTNRLMLVQQSDEVFLKDVKSTSSSKEIFLPVAVYATK